MNRPYINQDGAACYDVQGVVETSERCPSRDAFEASQATPEAANVAKDVWLDAIFRLAGRAAEARGLGWSSPEGMRLELSWYGDHHRAKVLLSWLGKESEMEEALNRAWAEAWTLVETHWGAVRALSDELLRKCEVSGEEAEAIVRRAISSAT